MIKIQKKGLWRGIIDLSKVNINDIDTTKTAKTVAWIYGALNIYLREGHHPIVEKMLNSLNSDVNKLPPIVQETEYNYQTAYATITNSQFTLPVTSFNKCINKKDRKDTNIFAEDILIDNNKKFYRVRSVEYSIKAEPEESKFILESRNAITPIENVDFSNMRVVGNSYADRSLLMNMIYDKKSEESLKYIYRLN